MAHVHQLWRFPRSEQDLGRVRGWERSVREAEEGVSGEEAGQVREAVTRYHAQESEAAWGEAASLVVQRVHAPVEAVWSVVRQFDKPQAYKHFIRSCAMVRGDGQLVGSTREVRVVSGLPAASSTERLEILDEDAHVLSFRVVGGQHRLRNYRSITSLHAGARPGTTLVVESYVVDVPPGNTPDDTRLFVDTIVRSNLLSLARISEHLALP